MARRQRKLAKYKTQCGARRFAERLARTWPNLKFEVVHHPYDFAWCVAEISTGKTYYAQKAKRNELAI